MQCAESLIEQVVVDRDAGRAQRIHLPEERLRVDHHAVPEDAELSFVKDPGGDQVEGVVLVRELDRVAGVVASLVAGDHVELVAEEVDDFAFAFVAPLGSDHGEIGLFRFQPSAGGAYNGSRRPANRDARTDMISVWNGSTSTGRA